jgi:hypothetical protein
MPLNWSVSWELLSLIVMCKGFIYHSINIILVFSLSQHAKYLEHETCIDFKMYALDDYFSLINWHMRMPPHLLLIVNWPSLLDGLYDRIVKKFMLCVNFNHMIWSLCHNWWNGSPFNNDELTPIDREIWRSCFRVLEFEFLKLKEKLNVNQSNTNLII